MRGFTTRMEVWRTGTRQSTRVQKEFFDQEEIDNGLEADHYNSLCMRYQNADNVTIVRGVAPRDTAWEVNVTAWAECIEGIREAHDFETAVTACDVSNLVFTPLGSEPTMLYVVKKDSITGERWLMKVD
jgi:hypothetical protein